MSIRSVRFALILALLAVACLTQRPIPSQAAAPTPGSDGRETLALLQKTVVVSANTIDLAKRLRGVKSVPPNPTTPIKTYQIGDLDTFWVTNSDTDTDFQVTARLLYMTPHVYMWFDTRATTPKLDTIKRSADTFETKIYPTVHATFGIEDSPGVDGDVHLFILNAQDVGGDVAGYFSSSSGYPLVVAPRSNQAQIFVMNMDNGGGRVGTTYYESVLAHEFQHMVHDAVDPNEETWLNEGLSELSRLVNGYADTGFASEFVRAPGLQLNTWIDVNNGNHYGASYLFSAYFYQRYGNAAVTKLVAEPENGLTGVDVTLKAIAAKDTTTGKPVGVVDLFADWQIANLLNDPKVGDGRYGYTVFDQSVPRVRPTAAPKAGTGKASLNQFGTRYLLFDKAGTYTFKFTGVPTTSVLDTTAHSGKYTWWSNRADKSDTTLTREFDLSTVKTATLDYWLWFSIEKGWDFGYLQVSEDGGQTWKPLATPNTITDDPHGNAFGPGYGGVSGSTSEKAKPKWIQESVDLSAYAGKKIQVRFEMVTDDAFVLPGLVIDDISLPEIGYQSDFEADDGGWTANGWIRMDNTLPQRYLIQKVTVGAKTTVERLFDPMATDAAISGEWTFTVGGTGEGATKRVILTLSGVTDYTTQPAPYEYELIAN